MVASTRRFVGVIEQPPCRCGAGCTRSLFQGSPHKKSTVRPSWTRRPGAAPEARTACSSRLHVITSLVAVVAWATLQPVDVLGNLKDSGMSRRAALLPLGVQPLIPYSARCFAARTWRHRMNRNRHPVPRLRRSAARSLLPRSTPSLTKILVKGRNRKGSPPNFRGSPRGISYTKPSQGRRRPAPLEIIDRAGPDDEKDRDRDTEHQLQRRPSIVGSVDVVDDKEPSRSYSDES